MGLDDGDHSMEDAEPQRHQHGRAAVQEEDDALNAQPDLDAEIEERDGTPDTTSSDDDDEEEDEEEEEEGEEDEGSEQSTGEEDRRGSSGSEAAGSEASEQDDVSIEMDNSGSIR